MRYVSAFLAVALGAAWVLPLPTAAAPTDDEAAIRATLRVLVDRFNTRDAVSLGGEVDYEYIYLPHGPCPTILICYNAAGREWFVRGSVSEMLWPPDAAQEDTYAFDLLNKEGAHEALLMRLCGLITLSPRVLVSRSIRSVYNKGTYYLFSGGKTKTC